MRISYDPEANAAYISLLDNSRRVELMGYLVSPPGSVAKTYPCDPRKVNGMINLDFDKDGRFIGIEVLGAQEKLPPELLQRLNGHAWIDL